MTRQRELQVVGLQVSCLSLVVQSKGMLEKIAEQKDILGIRENVIKKPPSISLVEESEIYGRKADKEKIIED